MEKLCDLDGTSITPTTISQSNKFERPFRKIVRSFICATYFTKSCLFHLFPFIFGWVMNEKVSVGSTSVKFFERGEGKTTISHKIEILFPSDHLPRLVAHASESVEVETPCLYFFLKLSISL